MKENYLINVYETDYDKTYLGIFLNHLAGVGILRFGLGGLSATSATAFTPGMLVLPTFCPPIVLQHLDEERDKRQICKRRRGKKILAKALVRYARVLNLKKN